MNKPTYQDLKQYHYDLWNWLAEHPDKDVDQWTEWIKFKDNPDYEIAVKCLSFACQAVEEVECRDCSLLTLSDLKQIPFQCMGGLYEKYITTRLDESQLRTKLALQIRDKWRE